MGVKERRMISRAVKVAFGVDVLVGVREGSRRIRFARRVGPPLT